MNPECGFDQNVTIAFLLGGSWVCIFLENLKLFRMANRCMHYNSKFDSVSRNRTSALLFAGQILYLWATLDSVLWRKLRKWISLVLHESLFQWHSNQPGSRYWMTLDGHLPMGANWTAVRIRQINQIWGSRPTHANTTVLFHPLVVITTNNHPSLFRCWAIIRKLVPW